MPLYFASINSGSNGNCYYVGNNSHAVLVDAGISCRETERRMQRQGLSLKNVRALFISHEHSDHIRGVEVISRKFNIPVYITEQTLNASRLNIKPSLLRPFKPGNTVDVEGLVVKSFAKSHDASDPNSFIISHEHLHVGVFTDIGYACDEVKSHFNLCHAAFLEANYDEVMLTEGSYPYYLKKRISSDKGHLSNHQALEIFMNHRSPFLSHVLLSHLSRENNSPQLVKKLFDRHANGVFVEVASRDYETGVFSIGEVPVMSVPEQLRMDLEVSREL
jgi:phosphoribosyl 1,2-cyclic phosphodiesterase